MKTWVPLFLSVFIVSGCRSPQGVQFVPPRPPRSVAEMSNGQKFYLHLYDIWRGRLTDHYDLPPDADQDKIRSCAAVRLKLDKDASWEDVFNRSSIRKHLTEGRRAKFVEVFKLDPATGWLELKDFLERARLTR